MKHADSFEIEVPHTMPNRVAVIKAIRSLANLGLKEAKDISDAAGTHRLEFRGVDPTLDEYLQQRYFDEHSSTLLANGVIVHGGHGKILQELRKLAAQAMEHAEDELANEILQLVLAEKLKRK